MEQRYKVRFGAMVKQARVSKGLTLDEVSRKVGTGKPYLSSIENMKVSPPRPRILRKLCNAIGLEYKEMLALRALALAPEDLMADDLLSVLTKG